MSEIVKVELFGFIRLANFKQLGVGHGHPKVVTAHHVPQRVISIPLGTSWEAVRIQAVVFVVPGDEGGGLAGAAKRGRVLKLEYMQAFVEFVIVHGGGVFLFFVDKNTVVWVVLASSLRAWRSR